MDYKSHMPLLARLLAVRNVRERSIMHRSMHAILTLMLYWPTYVFLDDNITIFKPDIAAFTWMRQVMTEQHWGFCCLIPAIIGSITLFSSSWINRMLGAGVLAAAHVALAAAIFAGNPDALIFGFLAGFALAGFALAYSTANIGIRFAIGMESSSIKG